METRGIRLLMLVASACFLIAPKCCRASEPLFEEVAELYEQVMSLDDAVAILQKQLHVAKLDEFAPLVTKKRVTQAIENSLASAANYNRPMPQVKIGIGPSAEETRALRTHKYVDCIRKAQPVYQNIIQNNQWPRGAYFHLLSFGAHGFQIRLLGADGNDLFQHSGLTVVECSIGDPLARRASHELFW